MAHFAYEHEITVLINSTFHLAEVEFSEKYHVQGPLKLIVEKKLIVFIDIIVITLLFSYSMTLSRYF